MHALSTAAAALAAIAALPAVSAHGYVSGVVADGTYYEGTNPNWFYSTKGNTVGWFAKNQDNGFVDGSSYGTGDITCHKDATPAQTAAKVKAGGKVELMWNTWPDSHHGPVIDYMARCPGDCTKVDKSTLTWFKIAEKGLVSGNPSPGKWATDDLIASNNSHTVTIPSNLAPGTFVLRHEIIALHSAGSTNGAQNYPQCINLQVTGSGTARPCNSGAQCPTGTALYKNTAPGILISIYQTLTSYTIPGPAIWSGFKSASKRVAQPFSA